MEVAFDAHLKDCAGARERNEKALAEIKSALDKSTTERREQVRAVWDENKSALKDVRDNFEAKHKENKNRNLLVLLALVPVAAEAVWSLLQRAMVH